MVLAWRNGKPIINADGTFQRQCCGCAETCPDVVCSGTNGVGWRVAGYTDGMFDTSCLGTATGGNVCGVRPTWDGKLIARNFIQPCEYRVDQEYCIDGWKAIITGSATAISLNFDGDGNAFYQIRISVGGSNNIVWAGQKLCGDTFAGIYEQINGCASGPSSVEVEENV